METWKDIPGFEGYYQASTYGRIRSIWSGRGPRKMILKPNKLRTGYLQYGFQIENKRMPKLGHVLILETFLGPRPDGMESSHFDGNRENNMLVNLDWETPVENAMRKVTHGTQRHGETNGTSKLNDHDVVNIRRLSSQGKKPSAILEILGLNVCKRSIISVINRETWKHLR